MSLNGKARRNKGAKPDVKWHQSSPNTGFPPNAGAMA